MISPWTSSIRVRVGRASTPYQVRSRGPEWSSTTISHAVCAELGSCARHDELMLLRWPSSARSLKPMHTAIGGTCLHGR